MLSRPWLRYLLTILATHAWQVMLYAAIALMGMILGCLLCGKPLP